MRLLEKITYSKAAYSGGDLASQAMNFSTAYKYSIDPALNRVKKAKFSFPGVMGLLDKYQIILV